jgi:hypothetical protein
VPLPAGCLCLLGASAAANGHSASVCSAGPLPWPVQAPRLSNGLVFLLGADRQLGMCRPAAAAASLDTLAGRKESPSRLGARRVPFMAEHSTMPFLHRLAHPGPLGPTLFTQAPVYTRPPTVAGPDPDIRPGISVSDGYRAWQAVAMPSVSSGPQATTPWTCRTSRHHGLSTHLGRPQHPSTNGVRQPSIHRGHACLGCHPNRHPSRPPSRPGHSSRPCLRPSLSLGPCHTRCGPRPACCTSLPAAGDSPCYHLPRDPAAGRRDWPQP